MDKTKKKKIRQGITWVCLAALVALLAAMPLLAGSAAPADGPVAVIKAGTAEKGDIITTLGGGGILAEESAEALTLPEGIKLTEYLVENGTWVEEGQPLARVDKLSLMYTITEIQETMDYLSGQIASADEGKNALQIKALTAGRVKQVFAEAGDDVQDVMREHGALAVLSLDGRMAVSIRKDTDYSAGDSVTVVLSDGTEIAGRVESALGDELIVTVADNGYAVGETVQIAAAGGEILGSGELYINNAWKATAYYGTVEKVNVKENDKVNGGKLLFALGNTGHSTQAQVLNAERQEYEELLERLFRIYAEGCLTAPCAGYVYGVDESSAWLLAAGEQGWKVDLLTHVTEEKSPWSVVRLSGFAEPPAGETEVPDETIPAKTWYVESAVQVDSEVDAGIWSVRVKAVGATVTDLSVLSLTVPQTAPAQEMSFSDVRTMEGQAHSVKAGDLLLRVTEEAGTYWLYYPYAAGNMGGMGNFGNMGSFGFGGGAQQETFEKFDLTEETVLTVTPDKIMTLDITIDELEIANVYIGQEATIRVATMDNTRIGGKVTEIGAAVNSGGNSKFTVTVTMDRSDKMLAGMSASAEMELGRTENVLKIPVAALNGSGSECFVYTGWSEKDGTLLNPVPVETGVSDGEYVQILSGLEAGDTCYYFWYEAEESSAL